MTVDEFKTKVELATNRLVKGELMSLSNPYSTGYGFYFNTWYNGTQYNLGYALTHSSTNDEVEFVMIDNYAFTAKQKYNKKEKKLEMVKQIKLNGLIEFNKDFDQAITVIAEMQEAIFYMGGL